MTVQLTEHLAAIAAGPAGPQVGAFFDLDGTLVAGFTATTFFTDQVRRGEVGVRTAMRTVAAAVDGTYLGGDPLKSGESAFGVLRGRTEDTFADLGERLFQDAIARTLRPQARELVRAHQRQGHTVVISSAATAYQIGPVARDLGIEHLICTRLELRDGVFTGRTDGPMRWGPGKARGVRSFAQAHGVNLRVSFGYGNGTEDVDFLAMVGRPVPLSPDPGLRDAAGRFAWPVLDLADPPQAGLAEVVRTAAALGGMNLGALGGLAWGAVTGDRRRGVNAAVAMACDTALRVAGVRLAVRGAEYLDLDRGGARPAIVVANHQSAIDPVVVASLLRGDFTVVAKKEARWDPRAVLGSVLLDPAFIDRSSSESARATLAQVADRVRAGTSLLIFPEGTRSPTQTLLPFKKGAFHLAAQAGVPVLPVVLRNTGEVLPRHGHAIRAGVVQVQVLPPVTGWAEAARTKQGLDAAIADLHAAYRRTLADWDHPGPSSVRGGHDA
ncbi:MAG: HAD-IB family hydrolase [Kineosporiaceae bacterium]|nr:HAD-IB family hydrolase [Kineosporiaceae bacterium]MBK8075589.1 HAD-IB family hydrolase [Kineosporiaceae bacterium]